MKLFTFLATLALAGLPTSHASSRELANLAPSWAKKKKLLKEYNRSYLDCITCNSKQFFGNSLPLEFFDRKIVDSIKTDYWVYQNQLDQKKNFGQMDSMTSHYYFQYEKFNPGKATVTSWIDQNRGYSEHIKNRLIDEEVQDRVEFVEESEPAENFEKSAAQVGKFFNNLNKVLEKESTIVPAPQPSVRVVAKGKKSKAAKAKVAKTVSAVKIKKSGKNTQLATLQAPSRPWLEYRLGTKTDLEGLRGQVWLKSTLVNTDVDLVAGRPVTETIGSGLNSRLFQKFNLGGSDLDRGNTESVRFRFYRDIPIVDLHASWTYGLSSTTMTTALSKRFNSYLRGEMAYTEWKNNPGQTDQHVGLFFEQNF